MVGTPQIDGLCKRRQYYSAFQGHPLHHLLLLQENGVRGSGERSAPERDWARALQRRGAGPRHQTSEGMRAEDPDEEGLNPHSKPKHSGGRRSRAADGMGRRRPEYRAALHVQEDGMGLSKGSDGGLSIHISAASQPESSRLPAVYRWLIFCATFRPAIGWGGSGGAAHAQGHFLQTTWY